MLAAGKFTREGGGGSWKRRVETFPGPRGIEVSFTLLSSTYVPRSFFASLIPSLSEARPNFFSLHKRGSSRDYAKKRKGRLFPRIRNTDFPLPPPFFPLHYALRQHMG